MKVLRLAAVSLTVAVLLALSLFPNSPLTDDIAFLSTFYGTEPPTIAIQQCDAFSQIANEPFPVQHGQSLIDIRVAQSHNSLWNAAAVHDLWLVARLYPMYQTGVAISWLFMLCL